MASEDLEISPYETDPAKIPANDLYADFPLYGRYSPKEGDFRPLPQYINSHSPESFAYWEQVLLQCDETKFAYRNRFEEDARDVFALGSVIIKSGHLHRAPTRDFSSEDANEVAAVQLARQPLAELGIAVPKIYFSGKIDGRDVLVQERIPGVALTVAHPYLNDDEMNSFKEQARQALRKLRQIQPNMEPVFRSYVVPQKDPVKSGRIRQGEADIIFSDDNTDTDFCFMHNDFTESNCVVSDGKLVGLFDWEMAGFFGWKTAQRVHREIRTPSRRTYARLEGDEMYEKTLHRIFFWKDLYDVDP